MDEPVPGISPHGDPSRKMGRGSRYLDWVECGYCLVLTFGLARIVQLMVAGQIPDPARFYFGLTLFFLGALLFLSDSP